MNEKENPTKPGVRFQEDYRKKLLAADLVEEEIKILEICRHVYFGHITIHKKRGKVEGRIEYKETY